MSVARDEAQGRLGAGREDAAGPEDRHAYGAAQGEGRAVHPVVHLQDLRRGGPPCFYSFSHRMRPETAI